MVAGSSPPARNEGSFSTQPSFSARSQLNVSPVPPITSAAVLFVSRSTAIGRALRTTGATSFTVSPFPMCTAFTTGRQYASNPPIPSFPLSWMTSKAASSAILLTSSTDWLAKTPKNRGRTAVARRRRSTHSAYHSTASVFVASAVHGGVSARLTRSPSIGNCDLTKSTISRACSIVTSRFDLDAKTSPIMSAPAIAVAVASSFDLSPHILTMVALREAPRRLAIIRRGSGARMSASPTRTPCTPDARYPCTSTRPLIPLRASSTFPDAFAPGPTRPASARTRPVLLVSTVKVRRSRLLTPMTDAPASSARRSSPAFTTSTSASMPRSRVVFSSVLSSRSFRTATISKTASAPYSLAS
mmetsp:Transcript_11711/g.30062  ORF Transcript_11711/g.30062 Transcript_11711/m.30062 type:complete len:358 (+) Transcript_11711:201-1274(+)